MCHVYSILGLTVSPCPNTGPTISWQVMHGDAAEWRHPVAGRDDAGTINVVLIDVRHPSFLLFSYPGPIHCFNSLCKLDRLPHPSAPFQPIFHLLDLHHLLKVNLTQAKKPDFQLAQFGLHVDVGIRC